MQTSAGELLGKNKLGQPFLKEWLASAASSKVVAERFGEPGNPTYLTLAKIMTSV